MTQTASNGLRTGDFVFLAFLGIGPMSAYDIKKSMSTSVSFFWSAAHSQVYQQANRLLRDGYIEERGVTTRRKRRVLGLSPKGREALEHWLREPARDYEIHDETLVKVFFGRQSDPKAVTAILEDQLERHSRLLAEYESLRKLLDSQESDGQPPYQLITADLGVRIERAWVAWIKESIKVVTSSGS